MKSKSVKTWALFSSVLGFLILGTIAGAYTFFNEPLTYSHTEAASLKGVIETGKNLLKTEELKKVEHIKTPEAVKAVYMSSWVAGTPSIRQRVIDLIDKTEVNAVVIDVKDYSGKISFTMDDPRVAKYSPFENRIKNIDELITELHSKNIYVIARVSVFQDNHLSRKRPDLALHWAGSGEVWQDRKKIAWLDVKSPEVWDYTIAVAEAAYKQGFDEINFDYIRFPSDGQVNSISYPFYNSANQTKAEALKSFFAHLSSKLKPQGIPTSADLFGMTMTNTDDLGIGQILENAAPYFDYIAPMVYPSHYPSGFLNYKNPASVPYEIINHAMNTASGRLTAIGESPKKLRPWLQDFDLGADYTPDMIRAEKKAVYDAGLNSWMMWDPQNKYTSGAYNPESN